MQSHSDLLCEFILQEFYGKLGVNFKFVSYVRICNTNLSFIKLF